MTNRIEVCHEPDDSIDIKEYEGVLRANGRRYSQEETHACWGNTISETEREQYRQMSAKQKAVKTELKTMRAIPRRRESFPGRMPFP